MCSKYSISIYIYINLASVNTALLHHTAAGGETAVGGDDEPVWCSSSRLLRCGARIELGRFLRHDPVL